MEHQVGTENKPEEVGELGKWWSMKRHLPTEKTLETVNNLLPLISAYESGYGDVRVGETILLLSATLH